MNPDSRISWFLLGVVVCAVGATVLQLLEPWLGKV